MRKDRRRALWVAACATTALAGCGGGGGVLAPPAPPGSPIPTTPGTYFQIARTGGSGTAPAYNLNFAPSAMPTQVGTSGFQLVYVDSASPPLAFNLTNVQGTNQLEAQGLGVDLGTFSEYFPASGGGTATSWGTRYRLYADVGPNGIGAGTLYAVDLRKPAGTTTPPPPVQVQVSNATVGGAQLCANAPGIFDNYRSANLSWIVFHAQGPDGNCGSLDDNYVAFQLAMVSATAPMTLLQGAGAAQLQIEPVEATYDTFGTITGFLAIGHPQLVSGNPSGNIPLQQLNASFGSVKTLVASLSGKGSTVTGGDFLSLGISNGNIWLYWDNTGISAVNLGTGAVASNVVALGSQDAVQGRAVFDTSNNAYVAISNASGTGSYVVQINLASLTSVVGPKDTTLNSIRLVGATSAAIVYFGTNTSAVTNLLSANKAGLAASSPLKTLSATQTIDSLMNAKSSAGPPAAFLVGDTVFFTVADTSATGATGFSKQAFYVAFNSATPGTATAIGPGTSAVVGVVAPKMIPTFGPISSTGALVMTGGGNTTPAAGTPVQPLFASSSPSFAASLGLYGAGGSLTNSIGTLSNQNVANSVPFATGGGITGVALNDGPVQAGMPATLLLFGKDGTGANAQDIAIFSSDNSTSFMQLSGFAQ